MTDPYPDMPVYPDDGTTRERAGWWSKWGIPWALTLLFVVVTLGVVILIELVARIASAVKP